MSAVSSMIAGVLPAPTPSAGLPDEYAFYQSRELTDITIPACITSIPDNVFAECSKEVTIHGASGSYAQSYAKKNNLKFKADLGSSSKKATKATKASGKAAEKAE